MTSELFYVKGLPELLARMQKYPAEVGKKCLRRGAGAGASVAKKTIARFVPVQSGTLLRSEVIVFERENSNDRQAVYAVVFRRGKGLQAGAAIGKSGKKFRKTGADAFYAPWVEHGHRIVPRASRGSGKGGKRTLKARRLGSTAVVSPHAFLEPGFIASKNPSIDAMKAAMTADLDKLPL